MLSRPFSKLNTNRLFATFLILAIVLSMSGLVVPTAADFPQGNNVSWQSQEETTQNTWNWTSQGWQFGPYPTFNIILSNGTEVTNDNYIPLDQVFTVRLDVQKSIFVGNATLGQAGLNWNTDLRLQNGSSTGNANARMVYVNSLQGQGSNQTNEWQIYSSINNQSQIITGGKDPLQPQPMQQQSGFFQFNSQLSNVTESEVGWRIHIVGAFNSSAPKGPYSVNMQISDQNNNWIDANSQAGQMNANNRQVAVGQAGFIFGGYQDYWTFEKVDMQNNPLLSVSKGALWKMRLNVTSSQFTNATIGLNLPWNIQQSVNVTGWYQQVFTEPGGWMLNETSGTYYWNSTVLVTKNQQVYGPHLEQRGISLSNTNHQVNITDMMWNPVNNTNELSNRQIYVQDQLFLMFNQVTQTFDLKIGYSYNSYDPHLKQMIQYQVLNPINASDPSSQFYNLSVPDCNYYKTGPNNHVVEFVGVFTNTTNYAQDQYYPQISVFTTNQQIWTNWENNNPSDMQIIIDRPVAVTTILDNQGRAASTQSMFMIGTNKPFIVQSKIYGSSQFYQDLDAIGVSFYSNFGTYSEKENSNSQVEIRLVKNLDTNALTSTSYNRTNVNRYLNSSHLGWAYVNVTDWHTEYNSTTSTWDWVESPHLVWNQTTLTDWHWEYSRLNQTEYAINPLSPNIWMDTTTCYIDDMDPAFITPTNYATLNAANITLVNGVVLANLNVTFNAAAPQGNYWYSMLFQQMTYGQDMSQGWGQHQITEWTSEPTYYVNDNDGKLLVNTPSNPLYTVYNGQKYKVSQVPYITIAGNNILIKPQVQYDQWRQQDWTQYLINGPYDPSIGRETKYYQLPNGSKLCVNQAYQTVIRQLQLNISDAYVLNSESQIPVDNGTILKTYMNYAIQDYDRQFWDTQHNRNVVPSYYELLNGSRIYLNSQFEQSEFNTTTNHYQRSNPVYNETDATLLVESVGSGVKLDNIVVLLRTPGSWQSLPDGSGYYLVMQNGTRIIINNPWVSDNERVTTINGVIYHISNPTQYYQASYDSQTLLIPTNGKNNDNYVLSYFYTNLGITGGQRYELPYPGAMATSWWDLEGIESTGQKLKTLKSITIDGTDYILNLDSESQIYYITINGQLQSMSYPTVDQNTFYSSINGQDYWNITQNGWKINFGSVSIKSGQVKAISNLVTTTGYDSAQQTWANQNHFGYDYENSTYYLMMTNGTRLNIESTMNLIVWEVKIGEQTYYTTDMNPQLGEPILDPSGQYIYPNYFRTLNGTKVYFDWNTPANWRNETHFPIAATNYTKLVPFTWQNQTVFDKIVIFNITIPEQTGTGHTYVYYGDGTEVPVNTNFKVLGTKYGPATNYRLNQQPDGTYIFDSAEVPMTNAPWSGSSVGYCITLDGTILYSLNRFDWNGNMNGDPWNSHKQWAFYGDAADANKTVSVVQGGYAIYLNNTLKVGVTTSGICGDGRGNYVVLTNGTRLDVFNSNQGGWFTVIGGQKYVFNNVLSCSNVTDGGIVYNIADPLQNDQRRLYTPTVYSTPTINNSQNSWLWINSTTSSILEDGSGYYITNAENSSRFGVELVDSWWGSIPTLLRTQVFQSNQQPNTDYYPRYSVSLNGQEYFVLDPSPVTDRWNGDWSYQSAMYRYPTAFDVTIDDVSFTIPIIQGGNWNGNLTIRQINTINVDDASYELEDQYAAKPSYQVTINDASPLTIQMETMNIYKTHLSWGNTFTWKLTNLGIATTSQVNSIIVGTPQFGMWGIRAYKTVEATGAVDLNGDTSSSSDQYFVRKIHLSTESQTQTTKRMMVQTNWNPDAQKVGDEIRLNAWMGQLQVSWASQWNESYVWYHASDMSEVSSSEMNQIKNTVVNNVTQQPNPGYWDIAYMVRNQSWEDVLNQAKANNWDWISSNKNEWNWLWFGTDQNYNVNVPSTNTTAGVDLKYEFAGLNVLNGTEQTHYFMPKTVRNVTFVTPGQDFGIMNASGSMLLPLNSNINFGVVYDDVNGTLFPYSEQRSMWGWWDSPIFGSDFNAPNFNNKPTSSSISQLEFMVHFGGTQRSGSQYNSASMKIDQRVGDWSLPSDVVDGRQQNSSSVMVPLMGNEVLQNRSLAINYYVTASTSLGWNVKDDSGSTVANNGVTNSSSFNVASQMANVTFASVKLGSTYDLGKPITTTDDVRTFNVTSQTTSIQNFQSSYQSGAGKSSTGFDISSSMYFLTQAFPRWDGYSIYNDPEVSVMASQGTDPTSTPSPSQPPGQPTPPPTQNPTPTPQPTQSATTPQPTSNPTNQPTNQPTPKPIPITPSTTPTTPSGTIIPKTTPPTSTEIPSMTIVIIAVVGAIAAVGSLMAVRMKKRKTK
jgi:hypothetical protein